MLQYLHMDIKDVKKSFEQMVFREKPSQVPFVVIRRSYNRMLKHCMTQDMQTADLWACRKNGAKVKMRVVRMNVFNRDGSLDKAGIPVGYLFCSGCDKEPLTKAGDAIFRDELVTLAV